MIHNIIGIDPSMTGTGIADENGVTHTVNGGAGDERLESIHRQVHLLVTALDPNVTLAVVEDLPQHAKSAGITGMAQGVVRLALREAGIRYVTVVASTLKKYATGKGNAPKPDLRMALYKRTGADLADDNQVDAAWLRYMGLDVAGHPEALDMPAVSRAALVKVSWPHRFLGPPHMFDGRSVEDVVPL